MDAHPANYLWLRSRPVATGDVVVVRLGEGARLLATFADAADERDITWMAADLTLIGIVASAERMLTDGVADPVDAGSLRFDGPLASLEVLLIPATGPVIEVSPEQWLASAAVGVAAQLEAGIARSDALTHPAGESERT